MAQKNAPKMASFWPLFLAPFGHFETASGRVITAPVSKPVQKRGKKGSKRGYFGPFWGSKNASFSKTSQKPPLFRPYKYTALNMPQKGWPPKGSRMAKSRYGFHESGLFPRGFLSLFEWDLKKWHFLTAKYEGFSHLHCKLSLPELQNGSILGHFGRFWPFFGSFLDRFLRGLLGPNT
jgi:hypothetical protein